MNVLLPTWDVYPPYNNNPESQTQVGVYVDYADAAFSGRVSVQFWNRDNANGTILILPEFTNINDLEFKFKASKANNTLGTLTIGYWKDNQYTALHTVSNDAIHSRGSSGHNATGSYAGPFTFENAPSGSKIALRYYYPDATTNTGGCINLDDFVIRNVNCTTPSNLVTTEIGGASASFSWTGTGSGTYQYVCVPQDTSPDWSNATTTSNTSASVGELTLDTNYDFYVRKNCSNASLDITSYSTPAMLSFSTAASINTYTITVTANPSTWGTVTGGGTYNEDATATLTATPASKYYSFLNWTKNDVVVSTDATYTFSVAEDATYVANFENLCEAITIVEGTPWTENFENLYHTSTTFSSDPWTNSSAYYVNERCWDVYGPYSFPALYFDTPVAFSGRGNLQFMNRGDVQILVLPEFTNALNTLQFEFKGNYYNYQGVDNQGTLEIGYYDGNGFHAVCTSDKITTPRGSSGHNATGDYLGPYPLTGDIPSGSRMALRYTPKDPTIHTNTGVATGCINLDDFRVSIIPTCIPPTNLAANDITTNSAVLSWTANSEETVWTVYYKKTTDADYTEVAHATNPYTLESLDSNNQYQYYVVANCSDDDQSTSSALFSFNTEAEAHPTKIVHNPTDSDEMTWEQFVSYVNNNGDTYEGKTVTLMEDITDSITSGTSSVFKGTFDGQGHTLTISLTSTSPRCAPFHTVTGTSEQNPVTIKNLKVTGVIRTSHIQAAGFIGYVNSYCTITNCVSDVTIISSFDGHGARAAGFIGQTDSQAHVTFTGCAFTGKLLGESSSGCAGFVGFNYSHYNAWSQSGSATVNFTDCVFVPAEITMGVGSGNAMSVKSATFARSFGSGSSATDSSEGLTFNNCYFTQSFGTVQGKRAYSITSFVTNINPITVELYGEHTYYDVSDIDGYATGIVYNGTIYAGNGENVSLVLEGSPSGAYDATYGTITGTESPFTLAMIAHNTEISALTCPAPTGLEETEITAYNATLNWNGISDNYNVRFYEAVFFDSFEEDLSQWTIYHEGDESTWEWGIENPNDNSSDLSAHSGNFAVVAYGMDSVQADNWLISPQIEFPTQTTLKFWVMRSTYDEFKDEYEVLLSTTGNAIEDFTTILKESEVANSYWTEVVIDLSEYDGETGYIAIRHNHYHGFFIMVDDFGIYGWSELIPVNGNSYTLEGLQPDTYYQWQVQADCGEEDGVSFWSETSSFKTLETCPTPFNLTASEVTAYGATLNWTGYSESYEVMVGELQTTTINYDFEEDAIISEDFSNTSAYPWTIVSGGLNGSYCIKSGNAGQASTTSSISLTITTPNDGTIEFDAECMGEGTSSLWDHCDFYIDNTRKLYYGANVSGWNHYSFAVTAGEHTFTWSYTKDGTVDPNGDYFAVDNIVVESTNIASWMSYEVSEPPFVLVDAENIQTNTSYVVKVKGFCEDEETEYSETVTFTTLDENTKIFVFEGEWSNDDNWVPAGVPTIDDDVILRAEVTVFDVAEANSITIDDAGALTIEDGGQLKTNADVEATIKKFIIGYGTDNVETDNGYYLMTLPTAAPISAADAGLLTEESDYDLYSWDRTATDEEWQNNHDGIDLQNGMGFLYANRDDMEMIFTAMLRNSSEPVVVTPSYDEVEHGGWNLCGNPFPCEAYITTDAEGMTFYRLVDNQLELIEGAIAPLEAFFVKATAAGQTFTISREATEEYKALMSGNTYRFKVPTVTK